MQKELTRLENIITEQEEIINDLKDNIHLHIWTGLLNVSNEFSLLLNPPPVEVKGTFKNKSEKYLLKVEDIVQLTSKGRYKEIYLKNVISGRGESERSTDTIIVDSLWNELIDKLDRIGFHFVMVDKGAYVNVKYFRIDKQSIKTEEGEQLNQKLREISYPLDKVRRIKFMNMKDNYTRVSLQKTEFCEISKKIK